jgi:hypothetical protein
MLSFSLSPSSLLLPLAPPSLSPSSPVPSLSDSASDVRSPLPWGGDGADEFETVRGPQDVPSPSPTTHSSRRANTTAKRPSSSKPPTKTPPKTPRKSRSTLYKTRVDRPDVIDDNGRRILRCQYRGTTKDGRDCSELVFERDTERK